VRDRSLRIRVTFLGLARDQVGRNALELELHAGATFGDLLNALAPHLDGKLGGWAWDSARREFSQRVKVSRSSVLGSWGPDSPLTDGEEVIVFPPMAGG